MTFFCSFFNNFCLDVQTSILSIFVGCSRAWYMRLGKAQVKGGAANAGGWMVVSLATMV